MKIKIENFGKIKLADITIGDFTIFVGDNNSGKTYLMQLAYGVIDAICKGLFSTQILPSLKVGCSEIENIANEWLNEKKEKIVLDTFNKKIAIGSIKIEIERSEKIFSAQRRTLDEYKSICEGNDLSAFELDNRRNIFSVDVDGSPIAYYAGFANENQFNEFMQNELLRNAIQILLGYPLTKKAIFLPASRSGLMLARPFLFANKSNIGVQNIEHVPVIRKYNENEFGLTQPVYDFLKFLQTHKTSETNTEKRKSIISFINKNIIHGQLKKTDNESLYQPEGSEEWLLPSLTSSMVNEISPIMQILTSVREISYIFYDEIETCQHPTTQIQIARLLNRMINAGYKMIVSTHSDTMAASISNLIALSVSPQKNQIIEEIGYEDKDILKTDRVHAYQFEKTDDGMCNVVEIPKYDNLGMGYDFSLFNQASDKIFNLAKRIYGD